MAATIKDIAKRLNISVSTVSYALNGGPRSVPTETRDKVLSVARELNYRPNRVARSMVTGRSHTIGIIPPEVIDNVFLSPYLQLAMNAIVNEAGHLHQDILLFTRYDDKQHEEMLSTIVDGRVDGVVFIAPHLGQRTTELATALHLPCVVISGAALAGVPSFTVDNEQGMAQAMQHLYDLGHRRIGHIAGRLDMQDAIVRLLSYENFLQSHGLPHSEQWVERGRFLIDGGRSAAKAILNHPNPPTAITCGNDEMAIGAVSGAIELGLRVPEDVSIVGFDNSPVSASAIPPLTTIRQPIAEVSAAAVRALYELVEGRTAPANTVFKTELIVRASTFRPKEDTQ